MPVASLAPDFQKLLRLSALTRASLAPRMMTSHQVISTCLWKEGMSERVRLSRDWKLLLRAVLPRPVA